MTTILIVFGTRPEAIKLFPVIHALNATPGLDVRVCVTAQHREMLDQVLAATGLTPDIDLDIMRPGQSLDTLAARLLVGLGEVMDQERPALVIVQGDTATALAGAMAAHHRRIPVGHVEAGLRSGDLHHPWPEEGNRRMISAITNRHWTPTDSAATALRREGIGDAAIRVTGNTVVDALLWMRARIAADPAVAEGLDACVARIAGRRTVLVTTHRRENWGDGMAAIARALVRIADRDDLAVLLPVHPNPTVRDAMEAALAGSAVIRVPPLDYPQFVRALDLCTLVLTDSGGVQEEAPSFGKPVLVMRQTTERPEAVMAGTARLIGTDEERIVSAVLDLIDDPAAYAAMARTHHPFGDGRAAMRIAADVSAKFGEQFGA